MNVVQPGFMTAAKEHLKGKYHRTVGPC